MRSRVRPEGVLGHIRADAGQIEQVVLNLVVNARDAMPTGGTLTIQTNTLYVDDAFARIHAGSFAGEYVPLTVTDTGQGMSAEVQAQIFTPFFTTKGPGAGTGLGLATVHRIVQQASGFITVNSTPGHGASFGIYLPMVNAPLEQEVEIAALAPRPRASGTILLAEDDERIRTLDARALSRRGYTVLPARDAVEAQRIAASHGGRIDLFIQKPYAPLALAQKVREVLED